MKQGIELIAEERERQVSVEGWTPEHDDEHDSGELSAAAECYVNTASLQESMKVYACPSHNLRRWPWDANWWKPSADPIRNLVKAGALIAAEIDRLQRERGESR